MKSKKKTIILYTVIVLILIAGIALWGNKGILANNKTSAAANTAEVKKSSVKVTKAKAVQKALKLSFKANLEPVEEGIVSSKTGGKVVEILFENGKNVAKGDALIKFDDQDIRNNLKASESQLAASQANLEKLNLNLENAQNDYDRKKSLFDQGAISKSDMEKVEATLKSAKVDITSTKANIEVAQVNVNNLRETLANTIITAPINGILDEKGVSLGQYVNPGTVMAKVKNISPINAVIAVSQNDLDYIKVGQKAQVKLDGASSKVYDALVSSVNLSADASARTFKCKVQIDNADYLLRPGTYAVVEVANDKKQEVVVVPMEALVGNEGSYSVFVNDNGIAKKRSITIGEITKDTVEVKSGIKVDEDIIRTNVNQLQEGDLVKVVLE